ncbi:MAG: hypothetical protein HFACDABA_01781 [Anaerolineales bacterium]|nr:hypothetical protein [Anaerolineales bacterium]
MTTFEGDLIIYAAMALLVMISLGAAALQKNKRDALLAAQAEKRGGTFAKRGLFRHSEARLPCKGNTLIVYCMPGSRNSPARTIATLHVETMILPAFDILRNDLTQKIMGAFGRERILLNDEEFDRKCIVRSEDPFLAQRILTSDMQRRFLDPTLRSLELRVSRQNVQVKMLSIPSNEETFDYFIDTVFVLLQKIV